MKRILIPVTAAAAALLGVGLFFQRPAAADSPQVVGTLSPAAVQDIVEIIRHQNRARVRECLLTGRIQSAWYYFQEARYSSIEAILQREGGSVGVVELVRIPQQALRRRTSTMGGWTGNWTGTGGSTNATEH